MFPALVGLLALAPAPARAAEGPVALVVNSDDPAFAWADVQAAVVDTLGAPVVATDDPRARQRRGLLTIAWRPSRHELAVTYEDARGTISRVVPAPDDAPAAVTTAAALAENLVRDQAAEALGAADAPPKRPRVVMDDPLPPATYVAAPAPAGPIRRWMVALSIGTGIGWASGYSEISTEPVVPGLAWARLGQIEPEVGFRVLPDLMLSVAGRFQLVTGPTERHLDMTNPASKNECGGDFVCEVPQSASAMFVKATIANPLPESGFAPYVSFSAGAGQIRHAVRISSVRMCGPSGTDPCVDTILAGPVFAGAGAGLRHRIWGPVALVVGLETLVGMGDFTFQIDANMGAAVVF